jgi:hypothetical protein
VSIRDDLERISAERLRRDLFHISSDPLPYRAVNQQRPGQRRTTLEEADDFIRGELESAGYAVASTTHRVQAFRCDRAKPLHHWYSTPDPADPFHDITNLEATRRGRELPDEFIQLVCHKDSMSWIDSPGAHDNAVGTVANLELARAVAALPLRRSVRVLFCNEEHTPWTSRFAAEAAAARGDRIVAVLNQDSLDGKSEEEMAAGRLSHVVCWSTEEGRALAERVAGFAARHAIPLEVRVAHKEQVNDDDGMYIHAGFRRTVMNIGSWPYADSQYHLPGDTPDRVNIRNLTLSTMLILASILELDASK